jgi:hypothetical protein
VRVAVGDDDGENRLHENVQSNSCTNSRVCAERAISH